MRLYFPKNTITSMTGFADARYLSDPDDAKSQTGYVFLQGSTTLSWKSTKQSLTTTSSNHSEIHQTSMLFPCCSCVLKEGFRGNVLRSTFLDKSYLTFIKARPTVFINGCRQGHSWYAALGNH